MWIQQKHKDVLEIVISINISVYTLKPALTILILKCQYLTLVTNTVSEKSNSLDVIPFCVDNVSTVLYQLCVEYLVLSRITMWTTKWIFLLDIKVK